MFGFIKKMFIGLLTSTLKTSNFAQYILIIINKA